MKRTLVLVLSWSLSLAAMAATSPPPAAKPTAAKPAREEGRFLFVVDTSRSMKSIDPAARDTVFDLLSTGIDGYMRTGDTFGIWTFDEEVGTGKFPMQVWNKEKPSLAARQAASFVREQEYKGENRIKELMLKLSAVLRAISNVNVLLITDGEVRIRGTPMDKEINAVYAQRSMERKTAGKAFITTLVAEGGKFTRGTVTLPGEPIQLPPRPEPPKESAKTVTPGVTNAPSTSAQAAKVIPKSVGDTTPGSKQSLAQTETPSLPGPIFPRPDADSGEPIASAPALSPSPASPSIKQIESRTEASDSPVVASSVNVTPNEGTADIPNDSPGSTAVETTAAPRRKVMQIITRPSAPATKPEAAEAIVGSKETNGAPQSAVTVPTAPSVNAVASPPVPALPVSTATLPSEESQAGSGVAEPTEQKTSSGASKFVIVAAREPGSPTPGPNDAKPSPVTAMQIQPGLGALPALIIGGILLAMSLFLLGIALRRTRHEAQGSLITQSMHRR